ncbi:MAG: hypothetical protein ACRECG_16570, partial [Bradyrhizobium sp.]
WGFLRPYRSRSLTDVKRIHDLSKVGVEGSNPFARSNKFNGLAAFFVGDTTGTTACWGRCGAVRCLQTSMALNNHHEEKQKGSRSERGGGNGRARHSHKITIDGEPYSWRGLGSRRFRIVIAASIVVIVKDGNAIVRGERGTATQPAPVSRPRTAGLTWRAECALSPQWLRCL